MKSKKALASDIYFEIKELESRMRALLVHNSTSHPEFVKLQKLYQQKNEKWGDFTKKTIVVPAVEPEMPNTACASCGSRKYWQTKFAVIVCITCHPPVSPEEVVKEITLP